MHPSKKLQVSTCNLWSQPKIVAPWLYEQTSRTNLDITRKILGRSPTSYDLIKNCLSSIQKREISREPECLAEIAKSLQKTAGANFNFLKVSFIFKVADTIKKCWDLPSPGAFRYSESHSWFRNSKVDMWEQISLTALSQTDPITVTWSEIQICSGA